MSLAGAVFQELNLENCSVCDLAYLSIPQRQRLEANLDPLLAQASPLEKRLCRNCTRRGQTLEGWGRPIGT